MYTTYSSDPNASTDNKETSTCVYAPSPNNIFAWCSQLQWLDCNSPITAPVSIRRPLNSVEINVVSH